MVLKFAQLYKCWAAASQGFCAMCEKKHKNLEAHWETPTPLSPMRRHRPDRYQLICVEWRLLRISIFFISTDAFTSLKQKTKTSCHLLKTVQTTDVALCPPLKGPAPDPWPGAATVMKKLWNTDEPVRQQYLQSHGQQLVLDVSTPPLLNPEETALSICPTWFGSFFGWGLSNQASSPSSLQVMLTCWCVAERQWWDSSTLPAYDASGPHPYALYPNLCVRVSVHVCVKCDCSQLCLRVNDRVSR